MRQIACKLTLRRTAIGAICLLALIGLFFACVRYKASRSTGATRHRVSVWERQAQECDKRFPKPDVITDYENALRLYKSGQRREAFLLVKSLVGMPIRLAPDSVRADYDTYYWVYMSGRFLPSLHLLREVYYENHAYAKELISAGQCADGIDVLRVNLGLSNQEIHLEPVEGSAVVQGCWHWRRTVRSIAEHVAAQDREAAEAARRCTQLAKRFRENRLHPYVESGVRETAKVTTEAQTVKWGLHDTAQIKELIKAWDREVVKPCSCLTR